MANPTELYVRGMRCSGCGKKLETRLRKLPGVMSVQVEVRPDAPSRVLVHQDGGQDRSALVAAVEAAGYAAVAV